MGNITSRGVNEDLLSSDDDDWALLENAESSPPRPSRRRARLEEPALDERLMATAAHVPTTRSHNKKSNIVPTRRSTAVRVSNNQSDRKKKQSVANKSVGEKRKTQKTDSNRTKKRVMTGKQRTWEENYAELNAFKAKYGHTRVPQHGDWKRLADWLKFQYRRKDGPYSNCPQLDQEKIDMLTKLDVDWIVNNALHWDKSFAKLKAFYKKKGHCTIESKNKDSKELAEWLSLQKRRFHGASNGWRQLNKAEIEKLESVGVEWD